MFLSDSSFSEDGSLLSFGQRQLFCLARAVLKRSICLVLDEATSNLDSETEKQFLKCCNDAFKGGEKTLITIAVRVEFFYFSSSVVLFFVRMEHHGIPTICINIVSSLFSLSTAYTLSSITTVL